MEDFGSILWVVVLIGFALFSGMSKGRKKEDKHTPQEAWPSWDADTDADAEPAEEFSEHQPRRTQAYGSPKSSYESTETYQGEAQSLEEIPEHEYTSLEEPVSGMSGSLNPHTAAPASGRNAFINNPSPAFERSSHTDLVSGFAPKADPANEISVQDNENNDLTADFDLRKAVIYSEMLKPKFGE